MNRHTQHLIPFLFILIFLALSGSVRAATPPIYLPLIIGPAATETPQASPVTELLELVNAERVANGCTPLSLNSQLSQAAQRHSSDMAMNNFFGHTGSDGSTVADRVRDTGYTYRSLAENIAAGQPTPQEVLADWMQSPGHRTNILNCNLVDMGLGYYYQSDDQADVRTSTTLASGPYYHYWTQTFGQPQ